MEKLNYSERLLFYKLHIEDCLDCIGKDYANAIKYLSGCLAVYKAKEYSEKVSPSLLFSEASLVSCINGIVYPLERLTEDKINSLLTSKEVKEILGCII